MLSCRCILCGEYLKNEMVLVGIEARQSVLACKPCLENTLSFPVVFAQERRMQ